VGGRIKNFFIADQCFILSAMNLGVVRRTKIISTLGPATDSAEMIGKLMDAGVNVFRLNMSHAPHDWVRRVVADIRAESAKRERFTGIMMDTQGPAIRTGDLNVPLDLQPGQKFTPRASSAAAAISICPASRSAFPPSQPKTSRM